MREARLTSYHPILPLGHPSQGRLWMFVPVVQQRRYEVGGCCAVWIKQWYMDE